MTDKKGFILNHQDFEPFGPEWDKEMMKLPKKAIIDLYRRACQEQPVSLPSANEDQEEQTLAWRDIYMNFNYGEGWTAFANRMRNHFTITRK